MTMYDVMAGLAGLFATAAFWGGAYIGWRHGLTRGIALGERSPRVIIPPGARTEWRVLGDIQILPYAIEVAPTAKLDVILLRSVGGNGAVQGAPVSFDPARGLNWTFETKTPFPVRDSESTPA
jgi:hypothetical protein